MGFAELAKKTMTKHCVKVPGDESVYLSTPKHIWSFFKLSLREPCYHNCTTFTKPIRLLMSSKTQNLARHFLSTNEKSLNEQEIEKYIQKKWRNNRLQSILCLHI